MNETIYALLHRRSIRKYKPDMVSQEYLNQILKAGLYAANGGNNQFSRFIVITEQERVSGFAHLVCAEMGKLDESTHPYQANDIRRARKSPEYNCCYGAPVLILVVAPINHGNGMADSACATQNMLNAAYSLGLGSCYMNHPHWVAGAASIKSTMQQFGMREDETIYCGLVVGLPDQELPPAAKRKDSRICFVDSEKFGGADL